MTVAELWQGLTSVVGQIAVYSSFATGTAFALFRFFGQKWIEDKFAQSLAKYKHEQAK